MKTSVSPSAGRQYALTTILARGGGHGHLPPEELLRAVPEELAASGAPERAHGGGEAREELTRLDVLKSLLARLVAVWSAAMGASARGQRPRNTLPASLNQLAHEQATGIIDGCRFTSLLRGCGPTGWPRA